MFEFSRLIDWLSSTGNIVKKIEDPTSSNRRRFQRFVPDKCKAILGAKGPFAITNLSYGGLGIELTDDSLRHSLKVSQKLPCHIFLDTINIEVTIIVRSIGNSFLGCSFSDLTPAHSRVISEFIKPVILGRSIREIDASNLKSEDDNLKMRWFQGDNGTQIFMWHTCDGENVRQEYYFLDYVMTWDKETSKIQTGKVLNDGQRGFGRLDPSAVAFFNVPPYKAIKLGKTILECASLPEDARAKILSEILTEEKRLFYRYLLNENGENVSFNLVNSPDKSFIVANLSSKGMALLRSNDCILKKGDCIVGNLLFSGKEVKVEFEILYVNSQLIGGNLIISDANEKELLARFLAPRLISQFLEEMPAPIEMPQHAPAGAKSSLYSGLHNTHILSLLSPEGKLLAGRMTFMDKIIASERGKITEYKCFEGVVFPSDWEIISYKVSPCDKHSCETIELCNEILDNSSIISDDVKKAWRDQLSLVSV